MIYRHTYIYTHTHINEGKDQAGVDGGGRRCFLFQIYYTLKEGTGRSRWQRRRGIWFHSCGTWYIYRQLWSMLYDTWITFIYYFLFHKSILGDRCITNYEVDEIRNYFWNYQLKVMDSVIIESLVIWIELNCAISHKLEGT